MTGYDLDGVLSLQDAATLKDCVVISGRTFAEYDSLAKVFASVVPVYIRGSGAKGDREDAARFKAMMINYLDITTYYEDDPLQAQRIQLACPYCAVRLVKDGEGPSGEVGGSKGGGR